MTNLNPRPLREAQIIDANYDQSTHNTVTSNAAATRLLEIAAKYLQLSASSSGAASSSTSNQVLSISTAGDAAARRRIEREIERYLNRKGGGLEPATKQWLREQLKEGAPLDSILDKVTLTHKVDEQEISTEWYLPLREVFVIVFKALIDTSEGIWSVPEGSTAHDERLLRLREFDKINNALAKSKPAICSTGVRHSWLQELDGYAGRPLPLSGQDLLFRVLRDFVTGLLDEQGISFSSDKDPEGEARSAFEVPFKTVFLPWLLAEKMPASMMDAMERAGGPEELERSILREFERIRVVPDSEMQKQIRNYSSRSSLEETPCDFSPFLARLYSWLKKHIGFWVHDSNAEGRNGKEKLAKQLISWLSSEYFKPGISTASSSSSAPESGRDSIAHFYQLERLFEAMEQFQKNKIVLSAADIPADKKEVWLRACDYLQERMAETEPSVARLLAEDERLEEHLKGFEAGYKAWRGNSYSDFITNFFVDWFAADDEANKATRGKLFSTLADLYFREQPPAKAVNPVIYLSDELLGKWTAQADEAGLIHLEPYQVNRFVLHALCYPPSTWTPQFHAYAVLLFAFIRNGFNEPDASIKLDFARDSYPESLRAQIEGLIAQYGNQGGAANPAAIAAVLTPSLISAAESIRTTHYLLAAPEASEPLIRQVVSSPGFDVNAQGVNNLTPLYLAAEHGNVSIGAALIEIGADVNTIYRNSFSPLYVAEWKQHYDLVRLLLDSGKIEVNAKHLNGKNAFYVAIKNGYTHSAIRLLETIPEEQRFAVITMTDSNGLSVLQFVADKLELLKTILDLIPETQRFAAMFAAGSSGRMMLQKTVAEPGSLKNTLELIPEDRRFDATMVPSHNGVTVLHYAVGTPASLKIFLDLMPESRRSEAVKVADSFGQTVLHLAAGKPESLKIILDCIPGDQRFEIVRIMDKGCCTVLHLAACKPESLKTILDSITEGEWFELVNIMDKAFCTVLHYAAAFPVSLQIILEHISEDRRFEAVMVAGYLGRTVLHSAANNPESLKTILNLIPEAQRLGVVMVADRYGKTVLHHATGNPESLQNILKSIPQEQRLKAAMVCDMHGHTALHNAACTPDSLKSILKSIVEEQRFEAAMAVDNYGWTVLHLAADNSDALRTILKLIPEDRRFEAVMVLNRDGQTALHLASDNPQSLKTILEFVPEARRLEVVNVVDRSGKTVMHEVVSKPESMKTILTLIPKAQRFEVVIVANGCGLTALHYAADEPESMNIILTLIPKARRLEAVRMTADSDCQTVLHHAVDNPEFLKTILELIPVVQRLEAINMVDSYGMSVLNYATENPESLRVIQELLPTLEQSAAFSSSSRPSSDLPSDSLDALEEEFYRLYNDTYKQLDNSFFAARLSSRAPIADVLRGIQSDRNLQVCIKLEWLNVDGTLHAKAPDEIHQLLHAHVPPSP